MLAVAGSLGGMKAALSGVGLFGLAALCNAALCIVGARCLSELRRKGGGG